MLTDEQKKRIEYEYEDNFDEAEYNILTGMRIVLSILGEEGFSEYLYDKFGR